MSRESDTDVESDGRRRRRSARLPIVAVVGRPNVGQVDAGEPDRRPARRDRRGAARASRATARSSSPSGPVTTSASSTPAAGSRRDESLAKQVSSQAERAMAAGRRDPRSWWTSPSGTIDEDAQVARILQRSGKPVLLVANKVDDPNRENDVWDVRQARSRRSVRGLGDPRAGER